MISTIWSCTSGDWRISNTSPVGGVGCPGLAPRRAATVDNANLAVASCVLPGRGGDELLDRVGHLRGAAPTE